MLEHYWKPQVPLFYHIFAFQGNAREILEPLSVWGPLAPPQGGERHTDRYYVSIYELDINMGNLSESTVRGT